MPPIAQDDSEAFVTEVCWHYYVNGKTQAEVAQTLGVTRLRVNQAMQKARALGVVKIHIESPFVTRIELQEKLVARFGLDKALVAPADREAYDYHAPVGAALASYLVGNPSAESWRSIGVSWGMTLQSAIRRLPQQTRPDVEIVSMIGGNTAGAAFNSFGIASGFAERFGSRYSVIAAPVYLSQNVDREAFLSQEIFAEHFRKCERLDAAILVAGDVSSRSFLVDTGLPGRRAAEGSDRRRRRRRYPRRLPRQGRTGDRPSAQHAGRSASNLKCSTRSPRNSGGSRPPQGRHHQRGA